MVGNPLLATLARRRILLASDHGQLRFRAPEGAIDIGMREALRAHKQDLLSALAVRQGFVQLSPLSYNQLSLFLVNLLDSQSAAYNLALTIRFHAPVEPNLLHEAVNRLVHDHGQLRTTLAHAELGGVAIPCQFVAQDLAPAFECIDAQSWSEGQLRENVQAFYRQPINLELGPVVQARVLTRGDSDHVFVVKLHHIAADGWSLQLLARHLGAHVRDLMANVPAHTVEPTAGTYSDYTLQQIEFVESQDGIRQIEHWRSILTPPAPNLELRGASSRPSVRRTQGRTVYFDIEPDLRARVESCAGQLGVTTFALQLAAFQRFLFERSGQRDVVVGVPTLGRRGEKYENTVGNFINPVPLRAQRPSVLTFREHAQLTAREMSDALDYREAPFAAVMAGFGGTRDLSRTAGFQVMFNVLSRRMLGDVVDLLYPWKTQPSTEIGGLAAAPFAIDQQEGQFDLTLELVERESSFLGLFKYCTDLFTSNEALAMAQEFRDLLERSISNPDEAILTTPVTSPTATGAEPTSELVIAATFTAESMNEAFEYWFDRLSWKVHPTYSPFNQVFQTLLDPSSTLRQVRRGFGVVLVRFDDLLQVSHTEATTPSGRDDQSVVAAQMAAVATELAEAIEQAAGNMAVPLCVAVAPSSPRLQTTAAIHDEIVEKFESRLQACHGVYVLAKSAVQNWYPVADFYEPLGEELGSIPYKPAFLVSFATAIVRTLHAITQKPLKALVLDCDGTLWDGVAAEDGVAGVKVDEAQRDFQDFLLRQVQAGVVLCLCSKNQENDVWTIFDGHPTMVLKREHIGFWRINWQQKSKNIVELASEMGLGLDSIAFLDDNPLEREDVRANCPAVLTVDFPAQWESRLSYLNQLWPMDHIRITEADRQRAAHYRSDRERTSLQQASSSLSEFLERLGLQVEIREASTSDFERLGQLSARTNQFNTTVQRMSAKEIANYGVSNDAEVFATFVRDRFGDYGLVGAILAKRVDSRVVVDSFLLSCRALGRGVEHRMAARVGEFASTIGCDCVDFPVQATDRNEPARTFLASLASIGASGAIEQGSIRAPSEALRVLKYVPSNTAPDTSTTQVAGSVKTTHSAELAWTTAVLSIPTELPNLDELKRSIAAHGKQRREGAYGRLASTATPTKPLSEVETMIAESWEGILGLSDVSTTANFFEIGGTSVLLAQLAIELKRRGLGVSIVDLLQYPTIAMLAEHMSQAESVLRAGETAELRRPRPGTSTEVRRTPSPFEQLKRFRKR